MLCAVHTGTRWMPGAKDVSLDPAGSSLPFTLEMPERAKSRRLSAFRTCSNRKSEAAVCSVVPLCTTKGCTVMSETELER
jgi:hypothetical protein